MVLFILAALEACHFPLKMDESITAFEAISSRAFLSSLKLYQFFILLMSEVRLMLERESFAMRLFRSFFISAYGPISFTEMRLMMCQPKRVLTGFEMSPSFARAKAASLNSGG